MYYVYVLRSISRTYAYVGLTDNLERRLHQHNTGLNKTTKPYAPFELVFYETFVRRVEARGREKFLKSGTGKEYIKSFVLKRKRE